MTTAPAAQIPLALDAKKCGAVHGAHECTLLFSHTGRCTSGKGIQWRQA